MLVDAEVNTAAVTEVNTDAASEVNITSGTLDNDSEKRTKKRIFFDAVLFVGWLCCLVPGPLPRFVPAASVILILCMAISFFDENFYLYAALFIYIRYKMLLGATPVFRVYSYMVVLRFLVDIGKTKFRIMYFPALLAFFLHSIFAFPKISTLRLGLNVIVDIVIIYMIIIKIFEDERLVRKFFFVFLMGGIASGIYGWTGKDVSKDINVAGAGVHKVNRNFGSLSDSNFAGLFYSLCIICAIAVKKIPVWLRWVFVALFMIMLLQTASLSALIVLSILLIFFIILKFRLRSVFIITGIFVGAAVATAAVLTIPQLRNTSTVSGLIIRITEKLSYIPRGRWDLVTTDRTALWEKAVNLYMSMPWWGKLIGGNVITVMAIDYSVMPIACHNSYIQSVLNFGVLGALAIYIPLFGVFVYRLYRHFSTPAGYDSEDIRMLQLILPFAFIVFGYTVDFFVDWPFEMLYFF